MHTLLRRAVVATLAAVLAAALGACTAPSTSGAGAGAGAGATLDATAFGELVSQPDVVVLDVRTAAEYAEGHLPDAVNADVEAADFDARIADLDPDATYAVYCRSGNRSAVALERMQAAGFAHVSHLDGGIGAWTAAGGAVER